MTKKDDNERGSALVLVLILMMVMTILGTSLLATAYASTKMTIHQENSMRAYFLAESGARTFAEYVMDTPAINMVDILNSQETDPITIGDGTVTLDVQEVDSNLVITANSIVGGVSNQATIILEKSIGTLFDYTILSLGDIDIANKVTVIGQVATNGGADVVDTGQQSVPQEEDIITNAGITFPAIEIPATYDQVVNAKVTSSQTINVTGEKTVHLSEGVSLPNHTNLTVSGNGTLHLYVSKGWSSTNHSQIIVDDTVKMYLYFIDNSNVFISSNTFTGTIYAPYSSVTFHNASGMAIGGRNFLGSIIAKEVYLEGNHTIVEHDASIDPEIIKVKKSYAIKGWQ